MKTIRSHQLPRQRFSLQQLFLSIAWCTFSLDLYANELPGEIKQALLTAKVPESAFSALVIPASKVDQIKPSVPELDFNSDQMKNPASVVKLVTTAVALDVLKPDYRARTQLWATETLQSHYAHNLYLKGGGDASFNTEKLRQLLLALRLRGVQTIKGDFVLDRSFFQPTRMDQGAPQFDNSPTAYYNVVPDALMLNQNLIDIAIWSDSKHAQASINFPIPFFIVNSDLGINNATCTGWDDAIKEPSLKVNGSQFTLLIEGKYPKDCTSLLRLNLIDRNQYWTRYIQRLWQDLGGVWLGKVQDGIVPAQAKLVTEVLSEPLADWVRQINKYSDNVLARSLYLILGATSSTPNKGTTLNASDLRVREWMQKNGVTHDQIVIENGSGLSRTDRLSARQIASVIDVMQKGLWYSEFISSLPITSLDGTMRRRLPDTVASYRARMKTGYLNGVRSIAGVVRRSDGHDVIVVGMVNHQDANASKLILDALLLWAAQSRL